MYRGEPQRGADGELHELDGVTRIPPDSGIWLYQLCRRIGAKLTLETGCAYGFSSMYFLAAGTQHIAVDPYEFSQWHGIAAQTVRRLEITSFKLIEEPAALGIPGLIHEGKKFDVIFIDDGHKFDDTLLEFTLSTLACGDGGYIVLDDMYLPSVRKVARFIKANRKDFRQIETPIANFAAFQKIGGDTRNWEHFEDF